jgi:hypothetical protein
MSTMDPCEICRDPSQVPDLVPGQSAICPGCGRRIFAPSIGQAVPRVAKAVASAVPVVTAVQDHERGAVTFPVPHLDAPDTPDISVARWRRGDVGTAAAFLCGSIGLLLASTPFDFLTKPLAAVGLLLGLLAGLAPAWWNQRRLWFPIAVCSLCLVTILFAGPPWRRARGLPPYVAVSLNADPRAMVTQQPVADDGWVDASANAMQTNGLRVQLVAARLATVELKEQKKKLLSPEKYLIIQLRSSYHGGVFQHLFYEPWADLPRATSKHPPTLTDSSKRVYPQITFEATRTVVGRFENGFLSAGELLDEVLVFPAAAAQAETLWLTLPAAAFGVPGEIRLKIPRSMIKSS